MTIFYFVARPWRWFALVLCLTSLPPALAQERDKGTPGTPGTPELMRALAAGGYVIYFRHGHTHWQQKTIEESMMMEGRHDLANCATQRNLDDIGRNDAARINAALQALRVPVGKVLGSLYCRPSEYVGLITGKPPVRTQWLTGLSTPETLKEIKREVATPPAPGTNTFLGGHGDRPFDLTGLIIQEGDALVFDARNHRADDAGKFKPVAWIKPAEWPALAGLAAAGNAAGAATVATATDATAPVINTVTVKQATQHDDANLRGSVPSLQVGAALDRAALERSVQLARENPSKNIEVLLAPMASSGTASAADAVVAVSDVKPWSLTAGVTNTSAANGRRERILLGGEHVNLWNRDHQIAAQLSGASSDWDRTGNTSVAYRAPVYALGGMLGVTATRARDGGGIDADLNPITGGGRSTSIYWRQHLTPRADYHHTLTVALDDRQWYGSGAASPVTAPALAVTPRVRSRPLSLRYAASWQENWVGWKFGVGLASNLSGGADNNDAAYALARANAGRNWNAMRADAEWMRILTYDIRLMLRARAQLSNQALIPGEQFALGGALQPWGSAFGVWPRGPWIGTGGVRGLPERALTGDSGAQGSVELWSRRIGGHDLRVGGFVDLGTVRRVSPAAGVSANVSASSLGALLHYQLRGNLALSLSAAHVLRGGEVVANRSGRVDLALIVRY